MASKLKKNLKEEVKTSKLAQLLTENEGLLKVPQAGELVKGTVISAANKEVQIDIPGWGTGVIRGRETYLESPDYANLEQGQEVEATVLETENENGQAELSFRFAGHKKVWDSLTELLKSGAIVEAEIVDANRGGLLIKVNRIPGFLPVSQLSPEHYPRVPGGDKTKILDKLKSYVKTKFPVKVITADETEEKLIVSEKAAWEEQQHSTISQYQKGDVIKGKVTAVTDFGAFVKFGAEGDNLEGLIHISELAWQRIDDPKEFIKVGQEVEARIINVEGSKIFLSTKALQQDPWTSVKERYTVGQQVTGKVLKTNPFGLFVELDPDIHGLAHISELSDKPIENISDIAKPGDTLDFTIISIEPENHRLGLSLKGVTAGQKTTEAPAAATTGAAEAEPAVPEVKE
ncbi:S1 RNA-binding domain-containing protein [Candidatus Falkowbacteria bacterium]|nr:S1 RNA-binding domain-containing protein [Candidatus Falkowbacteria bacterium]